MAITAQEILNYERGTNLQATADLLTNIRDKGAPIIGVAIALSNENWPVTAALAALEATDMEGIPARKAAELLDRPPLAENSERDHKADKKLYYCSMGGLLVRKLRQKQYGNATVVAANLVASGLRDYDVSQARKEAKEHGKNTQAIGINKAKTGVQMVSLDVAVSPFSKNSKVNDFGNVAMITGVVLGLIGAKIFKNRLKD